MPVTAAGSGIARLLLCSALLASTAGCAFRPQTTGMAVEHNAFVADTTNSQTVLNILRAREREPMHFTSFSKVTGSMTAGGQFSTNIAANGDGGSASRTATTLTNTGATGLLTSQAVTDQSVLGDTFGATNVTPQAQLSVNTGTSFDIAVNADDAFYKGILNPLPNSLIVHYLRQGFSPDLLSHLFINRIEFYVEIHKSPPGYEAPDPTKAEELTTPDFNSPLKPKPESTLLKREFLFSIDNRPDEKIQIDLFQTAMRCRQLGYAPDPKPEKVLKLAAPQSWNGLPPEVLERLTNDKDVPGSFQLKTNARTDFKIALPRVAVAPANAAPSDLDRIKGEVSERSCQTIRDRARAEFSAKFDGKKFSINGGPETEIYQAKAPPPPQPESPQTPKTEQRKSPRTPPTLPLLQRDSSSLQMLQSLDAKGGNPQALSGATFDQCGIFQDQIVDGLHGCLVIDMSFRSIEGVLYYLGEYVRNDQPRPLLRGPSCPQKPDANADPMKPGLGYCLPILRIEEAAKVARNVRWVEVRYRGDRYAVPISGEDLNSYAGRSSQTVSLVQQLLNLTKTAKDLPSTPSVRIVN